MAEKQGEVGVRDGDIVEIGEVVVGPDTDSRQQVDQPDEEVAGSDDDGGESFQRWLQGIKEGDTYSIESTTIYPDARDAITPVMHERLLPIAGEGESSSNAP